MSEAPRNASLGSPATKATIAAFDPTPHLLHQHVPQSPQRLDAGSPDRPFHGRPRLVGFPAALPDQAVSQRETVGSAPLAAPSSAVSPRPSGDGAPARDSGVRESATARGCESTGARRRCDAVGRQSPFPDGPGSSCGRPTALGRRLPLPAARTGSAFARNGPAPETADFLFGGRAGRRRGTPLASGTPGRIGPTSPHTLCLLFLRLIDRHRGSCTPPGLTVRTWRPGGDPQRKRYRKRQVLCHCRTADNRCPAPGSNRFFSAALGVLPRGCHSLSTEKRKGTRRPRLTDGPFTTVGDHNFPFGPDRPPRAGESSRPEPTSAMAAR